jgi:acetyl/propionyl-CoA carboxylase alpha subunit
MRCSLDEFIVEGIPTTISLHKEIMEHPDFIAGNYSTAFLDTQFKREKGSIPSKKKLVTLKRSGESTLEDVPIAINDTAMPENVTVGAEETKE